MITAKELADKLVQKLNSDMHPGLIEAHVRNLLWDNKEIILEALSKRKEVNGPMLGGIVLSVVIWVVAFWLILEWT
jgi:hypothetical protein